MENIRIPSWLNENDHNQVSRVKQIFESRDEVNKLIVGKSLSELPMLFNLKSLKLVHRSFIASFYLQSIAMFVLEQEPHNSDFQNQVEDFEKNFAELMREWTITGDNQILETFIQMIINEEEKRHSKVV